MGPTVLRYVSLKDAGDPSKISLFLGNKSIYTNISMGEWHTLTVDWNTNTDKMRIKLDDLEGCSWQETDSNPIDYISTFEISNSSNASRWVYIDSIE
jgi:hypothetical protein